MSEFIILHTTKKDEKAYINVNHIADFSRCGGHTRVFMNGDNKSCYVVKETPEEIYDMLQTSDFLKGETISATEGFVVVTCLGTGLRRAVCISEIFTIEETSDGCILWYKADKSMGLGVKEPFHEVCRRAGIRTVEE